MNHIPSVYHPREYAAQQEDAQNREPEPKRDPRLSTGPLARIRNPYPDEPEEIEELEKRP